MYHSSSWNSEPYHQNQNPAEGRYCALKSWTNTIMNRTGAPADCWLLCMIHASYILNHLSCEALAGNVPLGMLYGISPDISIILQYTFYQPVFYATHKQSYSSVSEERAACWVGLGEHVGDALTHKLLDDDTKKIHYRSAVTPSDSAHPNKRLVPDGGESSQTPKPIIFVRSTQDDSQSATKPMAEYNPDDIIGRTFLLPKNEQGERLRATIKGKGIETSKLLDDQHDNVIDKINFHLDVGQGRAETIKSYVQSLDHLDHQEQQEDLYKFRAITGHQGPLSPQDENYKGSKYNDMVEWETGEITEEPLSLIAADDPVTCAVYAKKHDLLHLDGWKRLKHIAKNQKQLTRAINQSKIGDQLSINLVSSFLRTTNKHYNWMNKMAVASGMMPLSLRWTKSMNTKSFKIMGKPNMIPNRERYQMPQMDIRKSGSTSSLLSNMMADTRLDWLLEDITLQIPLKASTLELFPSDPLDWLYS